MVTSQSEVATKIRLLVAQTEYVGFLLPDDVISIRIRVPTCTLLSRTTAYAAPTKHFRDHLPGMAPGRPLQHRSRHRSLYAITPSPVWPTCSLGPADYRYRRSAASLDFHDTNPPKI